MWEVVQNSASPQRASDNKTEHFLLYLEDFLDFSCFGGGGAKATHLPVVAYSVLQYYSYNFAGTISGLFYDFQPPGASFSAYTNY